MKRPFCSAGPSAHPGRTMAAILASLFAIGYADYLFGFMMSLDALYLLPVGMAAWLLGLPSALVVAAISAALPIAGDALAGQKNLTTGIISWNTAVLFILYIVVSLLVRQIRLLQHNLESQVEERTAKLTIEIAARERLEQEMITLGERDRRRLGEDVHDLLCQHLTACAISAEVLSGKVTSGSARAEDVNKVTDLIEEGIAIARDIARGLLAIPLGKEGLAIALEELAAKTSEQFSVDCSFRATPDFPVPEVERSVQIYRIVAESVSNAVRHGKARHLEIRAWCMDDQAHVSIRNDGLAFDPVAQAASGLGLRIMKQRAQLLDGSLDITSSPADGTAVHCIFPIVKK